MIRIRNVKKSFAGKTVLDDVSLDIPAGHSLVIVGRSGCGKSVLLKSIIGLLKPDEGTIHINGQAVRPFDKKSLFALRKSMGMLFQSAALFDSMSVGDNIALPLREHTDLSPEAVQVKVLEKLRLVGLDSAVGKMPSELSGGMKKRIGLARALIMDPEFILYDEPTTGLDPQTSAEINSLIRNTQNTLRLTSVIVTHELESAYVTGDIMAMLHDGRINFYGTIEAFKHSSLQEVAAFRDGLKSV